MPAELGLLEDRHPIARHLEAAAARGLHGDGGVGIPLTNRGRQTGGPWLVVSNRAELDVDDHEDQARVDENGRGAQCRRRGLATCTLPAMLTMTAG